MVRISATLSGSEGKPIAGARVARDVCPRLGLNEAETIHSTLQHDSRRDLITPPCNPDFHNLDYGRWQRCFDYWYWAGLSPKTLSVNRTGGKTLVSGSFGQRSADAVWTMMTSTEYQTRFDENFKIGHRPERVVVTDTSEGPRYSALWCKAEAGFEKRWKELHDAGWTHVDVFPYRVGATLLISSTWVKKPNSGNACYFDMTHAGYKQRFDDFWKVGLRVTTFCAYRHGSGYRYAAIWEKRPGRWSHWLNMTATEYQAKYNEEVGKNGMRLHQIQGYGTLFSAIFTG